MKNWILLIGISIMLFGCASVTRYPVTWKTLPNFSTPYDNAWTVVMDVITEKNIQLDVVQKESGYIKSSDMTLGRRSFVLVVKFTSKSPVKLKLQVMGRVFDAWNGMIYQTGIPLLEKQLLDEIEGRLRTFEVETPVSNDKSHSKTNLADETKLRKIKELYDNGLITKEEYDKERKETLDAM